MHSLEYLCLTTVKLQIYNHKAKEKGSVGEEHKHYMLSAT